MSMDPTLQRILKFGAPGLAYYFSRYLDPTDPVTVWLARLLWFSSAAWGFYTHYQIRLRIKARNDETPLVLKIPKKERKAKGGAKSESLAMRDYDLREWTRSMRTAVITWILSAFLHFFFKLFPGLLISTVLVPVNIFELPLYQEYMAGRPQSRPFKGEEGMFDAFKAEVTSLKDTIKSGGSADDSNSSTGAGSGSGSGASGGGRKFAEQSAEEKAEAFRRMMAGGSGSEAKKRK